MPKINNKSCAVFGCKEIDKENVDYYSFPKNRKLSRIWTEKCNRKDKINTQYAKICSRHFSNLQLKRMLKFELLNIKPPKNFRKITDDAVPDQNLKLFLCDAAPTVNQYSKSFPSESSKGSISSGSHHSREGRTLRRNIRKNLDMNNNTIVCEVDENLQYSKSQAPLPGTSFAPISREPMQDIVPNEMKSPGDRIGEVDENLQYSKSQAPLPGTSFAPISCEPMQDIGNVNVPNKMKSPGDRIGEVDENLQYLKSQAPLPGTSFAPISCEPMQDIGNVNVPNKMKSPGDRIGEVDENLQYSKSQAPLPGTSFAPISCEPMQDIGNVNDSHLITEPQVDGILFTLIPDSEMDALRNKLYVLTQENLQLKSEIGTLETNFEIVQRKCGHYEMILKRYFSESQVQLLISGDKQPRKYEEKDIIQALALYCSGSKSYRYLRAHLKFPLPCVATLNNWLAGINVEPGILNSVLRMMTVKFDHFSSVQKACILSFDEMKIERKYSYDKGSDTIFQPHNYVQVVMARGIISCWKQPVFYNYDCKMTKKLLKSLISKVEEIGFCVHAVVCDLGGANQGLLNSLGITSDTPFFTNPYVPARSVHFFADVPHLLKLTRNNLVDHGIETPYGYVSRAPIDEVLNYQKGDFKLAHNICTNSLNVKGPDRQKVSIAAKLLSGTTAKALQHLGNKNCLRVSNWKPTYLFIKLFDEWFDIMNSTGSRPEKPICSHFEGSETQVAVLVEIIELFGSSLVNGRVNPFMKGIVMSSKSLLHLFQDLQHEYSIAYLMTRRLNQDVLEQAFGIIRQMGSGHEHPDTVSFKYRMRRYILTRQHSLLSVNPNTKVKMNDSLLVNGIQSFKDNSSPIKKPLDMEHEQLEENEPPLEENHELDQTDGSLEFTIPDHEIDGFKYVMGVIVHKFKSKYEYLGYINIGEFGDWTSMKNYGGCKMNSMNDEYEASFVVAEDIFRKHHNLELIEENNAVANLYHKCAMKISNIPREVLEYYIRCRIYFRIRILNRNAKEENRKKKFKMNKISK